MLEYSRENVYAFQQNQFYLLQISTNLSDIAPYHRHNDFFEIICVDSSEFQHNINGRTIPFHSGDAVLMRPGEEHQIIQPPKTANIFSLSVLSEYVFRILDAYGPLFRRRITESSDPPLFSSSSKVRSYIDEAFAALPSASIEEKDMKISILLSRILQDFAAAQPSVTNTEALGNLDNLPFCHAIHLIKNPENIAGGVARLQELSGYSRSQLCRLMKSTMGVTPYEYVDQLRMNYALDLVISTSLPDNAIAEKIGFSSSNHFVATFKKRFGMTPHEKRKIFHSPLL